MNKKTFDDMTVMDRRSFLAGLLAVPAAAAIPGMPTDPTSLPVFVERVERFKVTEHFAYGWTDSRILFNVQSGTMEPELKRLVHNNEELIYPGDPLEFIGTTTLNNGETCAVVRRASWNGPVSAIAATKGGFTDDDTTD